MKQSNPGPGFTGYCTMTGGTSDAARMLSIVLSHEAFSESS